jgi:GNAT superfamily N-acetyltransferase
MDTHISAAQLDDAEAIADLVNQAYRPAPGQAGWTHEAALVDGPRIATAQLRTLLQDPAHHVLVMRQGPLLLACVQVSRAADAVWIGMLATAPQQQTRGLGKQMLAAAEALAIQQHGATVLQMAVLSSRPELLAFYQRRGYALTGAVSDYPLDAGVGTPLRDLQVLELRKTVR